MDQDWGIFPWLTMGESLVKNQKNGCNGDGIAAQRAGDSASCGLREQVLTLSSTGYMGAAHHGCSTIMIDNWGTRRQLKVADRASTTLHSSVCLCLAASRLH